MREAGYLLLEDGRIFRGQQLGARGIALGEIVFNTSMAGYQEILTDPSYAGQIVTMTFPLIGNYGVNAADQESERPQAAGLIVREISPMYSNWRAKGSLEEYMERHGLVGLTEVDTRALTRHIRSAGAMRAAIAPADEPVDAVRERIEAHPRMENLDLTGEVSTAEPVVIPAVGPERFHVLAYDFGVKSRSVQLLAERGCRVTKLPASTTLEEMLELEFDGLFVCNGPGDPAAVGHALRAIREIAERGIPVFGICLGHQLLARAFGGRTYKMLYGHRGPNHPVRRLEDGAVEITSQNHGFVVKEDADGNVEGAPALQVTHVSLNDGTIEGLRHREFPAFSVQYHPEASPGPRDSLYLFDLFIAAMDRA
ncbi:MAG TPA: glutamine-hydrolyzing carbamoyl-phosphate synthase small subunit [Longimicrobiales bacterium]|nr:glutamine-hydrolyzing carbamoyl-phosphate synthase small subunit [Longimicrobiales bacterium]